VKAAWAATGTGNTATTATNANPASAPTSQKAATSHLLAAPKPSLGGWVHGASNNYEAKYKKQQSTGQPHLLLSDTSETTLAPRRSRNCIAASNEATGDYSVQKRMQIDVKSRVTAQEVAVREAAYNRRSDGFYDSVRICILHACLSRIMFKGCCPRTYS
jgi:hypothetical protein